MSVTLDFERLNCDGCPARHLRDTERMKYVESLRMEALSALGAEPRWILLCESAPTGRFVYDRHTDYSDGGLRFNLREELVPGRGDEALFRYLNDRRIWLVDAALCPLHELRKLRSQVGSRRRHAATICLERHTSAYLDAFPAASVAAIFPEHCGFLKRELPALQARVRRQFTFSNLRGLKGLLEG